MNAVVEQLTRLPGIKRMLAKAEAEASVESYNERRKLVDEIEQARAKLDSELPPLTKAAAEAERAYRGAEGQLASAAARWRVARQRAENAQSQAEHEIERREAILFRSADRRIDEFLAEMSQWHHGTRAVAPTSHEQGDDRTKKRFSTLPSIAARLAAIRAARTAAERLKLQAYPDVPSAIEEIKATIPTDFPFVEIIVRQ